MGWLPVSQRHRTGRPGRPRYQTSPLPWPLVSPAAGIAREVVERNAVVGNLLRTVRTIEVVSSPSTPAGRVSGSSAVNGWPIGGAVALANTLVGGRVLGEEVEGHALGVGQEGTIFGVWLTDHTVGAPGRTARPEQPRTRLRPYPDRRVASIRSPAK